MQTLQFDYHIGNNYSLAGIRTEYPLLKFIQISHLKCHVLCALDSAINLHFIQFRDKLPSDPTIYPPSYALTGHPKILFTIEPLGLLKEVKGKSLNEEEFTKFYSTTADSIYDEGLEINTIPIKPGVILCRIVKGGRVYLLDLTQKDNRPQVIDSLIDVDILSMYDDNILLFSSLSLKGIFLYHLQTKKIKKLNFIERFPWILKSVPKRNLCISIFGSIAEILDTKTNNIVETLLFKSRTYHIIAVSPDSSRIVHAYSYDRLDDEKMYMNIWDVTKDSKLMKREPFQFDDIVENEHHVEFLNNNILIYVRRFRVDLFKVEEAGIVKIHSFSAVSDQGYVNQVKELRYKYNHKLSLAVVDPNSFLLITSDLHKSSYNSIDSFEINNQISPNDKDPNLQQEIGKIIWHQSRGEDNPFEDINLTTVLNIEAKHIFLERMNSIKYLCSWRNEKVGLFYDSYCFSEYSLLTGKLSKTMSLTGITRYSYGILAKISYFDNDYLVLRYEKYNLKIRLIVINIKSQTEILDTRELKLRESIKVINCADVGEESITLVYQKYNLDVFIGHLDLKTKKIVKTIQIDLTKLPDRIWSIGHNFLAGRCKNSSRTLVIWDLEKKDLVLEKRFAKLHEKPEERVESMSVFFWDLIKMNDDLFCLPRYFL